MKIFDVQNLLFKIKILANTFDFKFYLPKRLIFDFAEIDSHSRISGEIIFKVIQFK